MGWIEALVLAVVQGLTEFLPVSSSGHLVLAQSLLGSFPADALAYDLALHLGTAAAAGLFYRREIAALACGLLPPYRRVPAELADTRRLLGLLAVATVPTALIGLAMRDAVEPLFSSPAAAVAGLVLTGAVLLAASRLPAGGVIAARARWWQAALVGVAQGVAILPGVSRSGSTIAAALGAGMRREDAVRFSFLLALPAILGAALLELPRAAAASAADPARYLAGFAVSAAAGYAAIVLVLRWTRSGRLWQFGLYCWVVAAAAAAGLALAGRHPAAG